MRGLRQGFPTVVNIEPAQSYTQRCQALCVRILQENI